MIRGTVRAGGREETEGCRWVWMTTFNRGDKSGRLRKEEKKKS
jgi:hypothetical protein